MRRYFITYILLIVFLPGIVNAQYNHQFIHFDLEGEALLDKLRDDYTTSVVLDYNTARDTLFSQVYMVNDSLSGIYTNMRLYLDPSKDPTSSVYMGGSTNGINTEHCYPKSKGAKNGNAKSDMHHLFPSRTGTNSDRSSLPFGEINDSNTKKWYYKNIVRSQKPNNNIDLYSEWINQSFEPRESVKGNIARAMFYFFTIYHDKAIAADPSFFASQRATLCQWHIQDPVDSTEWGRSMKISTYQDDIANPFVLDCSLAQRAYCPEITTDCYPNGIENVENILDFNMEQNYPNPFINKTVIPIDFNKSGYAYLSLKNILNQETTILIDGKVSAGHKDILVDLPLAPGFYTYQIRFTALNQTKLQYRTFKMIKF